MKKIPFFSPKPNLIQHLSHNFNNWVSLELVTNKFWFNNILLRILEEVDFPLWMCSNAKDSGLMGKERSFFFSN